MAAIGGRDGSLCALLDEQDGDPAVPNRRERVEHDVDHRWREPERRLVEQQDVRLGDERSSDRKLLLLPAGQGACLARAELLDDREQLVDVRENRIGATTSASRREAEPEVLLDRQLREDPPPFGHERNPAARDLLGRTSEERLGAEANIAADHRSNTHDRVERRRLAGPVRADQADDLAGSDLERELAYSLDAAVANPQIGDDQAHDSSTGASPRYAAVTSRLERISAGAPSASTLPWSRTQIRSQTSMISAML